LKRWIDYSKKFDFEISIDGGIKKKNSSKLDAKYIVSGSEILNSHNAKHTIYDLKISEKNDHGDWMKEYLNKTLMKKANEIRGLNSATVVGSFEDKRGIEGISDLDFIVILDELTKRNLRKL